MLDKKTPYKKKTGFKGTNNKFTETRSAGSRGTGTWGKDAKGKDAKVSDSRSTDSRSTGTNGSDRRGTGGRYTDSRSTDNKGAVRGRTGDRYTDSRSTDSRSTDSRSTDSRSKGSGGADRRGTGDRYADSRSTGSNGADRRGAGGRYTDSRSTGSGGADRRGTGDQHTDSRSTGSKGADRRGTGGRYTDSRSIDSKSVDRRGTGGRYTNNRSSDSKGADRRGTGGRYTDSRSTDSKGADGRRTDGKHTDSRSTDSKGTDRYGTGGKHTDSGSTDRYGTGGKHTDSRSTDNKGADRRGTGGRYTDSRNTDSRNTGNKGTEGRTSTRDTSPCPVSKICGGCQYLSMPYEEQLKMKQKQLEELLKKYCTVYPISGMENPYHYRNKVHAVFDHDKKGNPISGVYETKTHRVAPVENCLIEDQKADEIIGTIRGMLRSFKIKTYDEDSGYGLLRHVLVKRGFATNEIMVVLVTSSSIFPSKNNFVKALRDKQPEITTIIQNVNGRDTSMVLGDQEKILYGKGYIEDILCGCRFRISSKSFYQINSVQTEKLYTRAMTAAGLTGTETVVDAYCGIGTIGIIASKKAGKVIGVELNRDAAKDAAANAKINEIENASFYCNDAGKFMVGMAQEGEKVDVVFMDPPRSGSTEEFIDSVAKLAPKKVVYISCNPETLERDMQVFLKRGYEAKGAWGVDLFPMTGHIECVVKLCREEK